MATTITLNHDEYPAVADLRQMVRKLPLPVIAERTINPNFITNSKSTKLASLVLDNLNAALAADDAEAVQNCFYASQAHWKDQLALTWHLRTFTTPGAIAASLLATKKLRGIDDGFRLCGDPHFTEISPVLVSHGPGSSTSVCAQMD